MHLSGILKIFNFNHDICLIISKEELHKHCCLYLSFHKIIHAQTRLHYFHPLRSSEPCRSYSEWKRINERL